MSEARTSPSRPGAYHHANGRQTGTYKRKAGERPGSAKTGDSPGTQADRSTDLDALCILN